MLNDFHQRHDQFQISYHFAAKILKFESRRIKSMFVFFSELLIYFCLMAIKKKYYFKKIPCYIMQHQKSFADARRQLPSLTPSSPKYSHQLQKERSENICNHFLILSSSQNINFGEKNLTWQYLLLKQNNIQRRTTVSWENKTKSTNQSQTQMS